MTQVWEDLKIPWNLRDNVCNDSKTTTTAQKCCQALCSAMKRPTNGTVNEEHEDEVAIASNTTNGPQHSHRTTRLRLHCNLQRLVIIPLPWTDYLPSAWGLPRSATTYQVGLWDTSIWELQVQSAINIIYGKLMTQRWLFPCTSAMT